MSSPEHSFQELPEPFRSRHQREAARRKRIADGKRRRRREETFYVWAYTLLAVVAGTLFPWIALGMPGVAK
jgi:hypothetical protein